jgi:hypothetical protein
MLGFSFIMPKRPSLVTQCEQIGWPLQIMYASYLGSKTWKDDHGPDQRPEELVATRIADGGCLCSWCEGGSVNLLMKSAALDVLAKRNIFNDRTDAIRRYLEAQCTILKDYEAELLACIGSITPSHLKENIAEICADAFIQEAYPRVRRDFLLSLAITMKSDILTRHWFSSITDSST